MYDREYAGRVLAFEPSGGLMNASLVMRDRETDSWWSIITGDAIGGMLEGTDLRELPVSQKMQWKDWRRIHPNTLVLSVEGKEHDPRDPYSGYFSGSGGFRGLTSSDKRLYDKTSIYAFQLNSIPYAVAHGSIEGGASFKLSKAREIFLYREPGSAIFESTIAYMAEGEHDGKRFVNRDGKWTDAATGAVFSPKKGFSEDGEHKANITRVRLTGFDTFWYIWTTTHEQVQLLH